MSSFTLSASGPRPTCRTCRRKTTGGIGLCERRPVARGALEPEASGGFGKPEMDRDIRPERKAEVAEHSRHAAVFDRQDGCPQLGALGRPAACVEHLDQPLGGIHRSARKGREAGYEDADRSHGARLANSLRPVAGDQGVVALRTQRVNVTPFAASMILVSTGVRPALASAVRGCP